MSTLTEKIDQERPIGPEIPKFYVCPYHKGLDDKISSVIKLLVKIGIGVIFLMAGEILILSRPTKMQYLMIPEKPAINKNIETVFFGG